MCVYVEVPVEVENNQLYAFNNINFFFSSLVQLIFFSLKMNGAFSYHAGPVVTT